MQSDPTPAAQVLDDEDTTAGVWFDAPAAEPPPEHEPTLLALAGELMDELAEVRAERQANAAAEVVQVERVRRQYADLDYPLATRENRIEGELRRIYAVLPRRGKAKSRRIAGGILGTRTQ
ncbi:MAG TPA: hypothetical protein VEB59_12355, partial [Gemmatimonadales bacterium]|nr:hypothetical protein [Gemmatimonadales bacterium]